MNKWRRWTLASLLAGAGAGLGYKAWAHGGWRDRGPIDPAELDGHLERMLRHLYAEIDATDAQKAKLAPIVKQAAQDLLPVRERMRAARAQAIELLSGAQVDRAALERLRGEQIALADDASRRLVRAVGEAAEVLTPEQRKSIAERISRRHGRWHGH